MMKARFFLVFVMFLLAATAVSASITDVSFLIKPETNLTVGGTAYLSLTVVSAPGASNFTVNITLISGSTNVQNIYLPDYSTSTGTYNAWLNSYKWQQTWPFTINSLPITYRAVITDMVTGENTTINASTSVDHDGDGYYSIASGGNDCNDNNANIHPGATEPSCGGQDLNCDGTAPPACSSSGGGGGGSGGGGSTSGRLNAGDINCSGLISSIIKNDRIKVTFKDVEYSFYVKDMAPTALSLKLYPLPSRDFMINQSTTQYIDLNRDMINDLSFKVIEVKSGTAKAECNLLGQQIPPTKPKTTTQKIEEKVAEVIEPVVTNIREGILRIAGEAVPKEGPSPVIGSIIVLAIVIGGLVGYYILRRGKKEEDFS